MKALLAATLLVALALSGCSGDEPKTYTCLKTGQVLDLASVNGSSEKGFDPETACKPPLAPSVHLFKVPQNMTVYAPAAWSWVVDSGNYSAGHSMATQLRWSPKSVADSELAGPASYGSVVQGYAHQEVEKAIVGGTTFGAKWIATLEGTYYVRAYAQIRGDGIGDVDYWTPEVKMVIGPVPPTGEVKTVTQNPGSGGAAGAVGGLDTKSLSLKLGDQVIFANEDAVEHTFTIKQAPAGFKHDPLKVAAGASSAPILFSVPGAYKIESDGIPSPSILDVAVAAAQ